MINKLKQHKAPMLKYMLTILTVIKLINSSSLTIEATYPHKFGRQYLLHSQIVLEYYQNIKIHSLRRHDLSNQQMNNNYQQLPLETNHIGFTLALNIAGIPYKLSMDTGSSDFFIKGENAPGAPTLKYKSNQSFNTKGAITIGYLDGNLKTYATVLTVEFNNHSFNAPILVAYTSPQQFQDVEGIIGLSYPQLAKHQPTFIQTLIKENIIQKYAFGMNLNLLQKNRSFISFGEADSQLYDGQLNEYSIGRSTDISIAFKYLTVGSSPKMQITKALLDTGNTCISIPRIFQQTILKQFNTVNNKCVFIVQEYVPMFSLLICKIRNFTQLPSIKMTIGNNQYSIEKEFYLQICTKNPKQNQSSAYYCETYIQSVTYSSGNVIILGDAFFSRFYTYFDLEDQKVGIAKNRENITLDQILASQQLQFVSSDWQKLINF